MNARERAESELNELEEKLAKLTNFLHSEKFNSLTNNNQNLLIIQSYIMNQYVDILKARLRNWID